LLQFGEIIFLLVEITANEGLEPSLIDPEEEAEKHMLKLCKAGLINNLDAPPTRRY